MHICDKCLETNYLNDKSILKSRGICEICGHTDVCNCITASRLNLKRGIHKYDNTLEALKDRVEIIEDMLGIKQL